MSEITTTKTLNMKFGNANSTKNIGLSEPLDDLNAEIVSTAMIDLVAMETLMDNNGNLLTDVLGAELETVTKQTLF